MKLKVHKRQNFFIAGDFEFLSNYYSPYRNGYFKKSVLIQPKIKEVWWLLRKLKMRESQ